MRFTESKKRKPWGLLILFIFILGVLSTLSFCRFDPIPQTVQKTIVFEAD